MTRALFAVGFAVLLLSPLAGAQEPYTHRFLVEGRLIGANGAPLSGVPVTVTGPAGDLQKSCANVVDNATTDDWGDFAFCYSQGSMHDGVVTIHMGALNLTRAVDQTFRRIVVFARDAEQNGTAPPDWNTTFRIAGRVLIPGSVEFGGVQAYGAPVANDTMNVTIHTPNATTPLSVHTDGNGDFDAVIRLLNATEETHARANLAVRGQHLNRYLDPEFHRINVRMGIVSDAGADVQASFDNPEAPQPQPGTKDPSLSGTLLLVAAASLAVMIYALRRAKK